MVEAPSFPKVLTGALCGAMLGAAAWMVVTGKGGLDRLTELHMVFMAYPVGAILGMRVAAGRGGTARWVVLVGSYAVWFLSAFFAWKRADIWFFEEGQLGAWLALPICLGGWAAVVWRSLSRLSGETGTPCLPALVLVGLWVTDLLWQGSIWLVMKTGFFGFVRFGSESGLYVLTFAVVPTMLAVILTLALGSLGSLAGNLDIPWAKASLTAVVIGETLAFSQAMVHQAGWGSVAHWIFPAQWLLVRVIWFVWWARRLG